jgi:hypothetical protein
MPSSATSLIGKPRPFKLILIEWPDLDEQPPDDQVKLARSRLAKAG